MINNEDVIAQILETTPPSESANMRRILPVILEKLSQLGYKLVPANITLSITDMDSFEYAVTSYTTPSDPDSGLDVQAEAIVHHLLSSGWTILPPQ